MSKRITITMSDEDVAAIEALQATDRRKHFSQMVLWLIQEGLAARDAAESNK